MCLQIHKIFPRYSSRPLYVPCGSCASCLQEKAARRARRIKAHRPSGHVCYFVTLTYDNDFIPYFLKSDVITKYEQLNQTIDGTSICTDDVSTFPIYRNSSVRFYRGKRIETKKVSVVDVQEIDDTYSSHVIKSLKNVQDKECPDNDRVPVVFYKDVRMFIKRLRINHSRTFGETLSLSYFATSEYGPNTCRPHFHVLLWLPKSLNYWQVYKMVRKAWPFDPHLPKAQREKQVQVARDAASYVSAYVNCVADIPPYLHKYFNARHSHSKDFGFDNDYFSFSEVFNRIVLQDTCTYPSTRVDKNGAIEPTTLPYPRYVLRRYFPFAKNYSRLSDASRIGLLSNPREYLRQDPRTSYFTPLGTQVFATRHYDVFGQPIWYSRQEARSLASKIENSKKLLIEHLGLENDFDAAICLYEILNRIERYQYKDDMLTASCTRDSIEKYLNIKDYKQGVIRSLNLDEALKHVEIDCFDANFFKENVNRTNYYSNKFYNYKKHRKLADLSLTN